MPEHHAPEIATFIMLDGRAAEAIDCYRAAFPDSSVTAITHHGPETGEMAGKIFFAELTLAGHALKLIDTPSPPPHRPSPAMTLFVTVDAADEVDRLYEALGAGCGTLMPIDAYDFATRFVWFADRFGVHWQLIFRRP